MKLAALALCLAALGLSACGTTRRVYEGPDLDPRQASWLNLDWAGNPHEWGYRVDGNYVPSRDVKAVEMKPGRHRLEYAVHGYASEDLRAGEQAARALRSDTRTKDFSVRWVDHAYVFEFDTKPGWGYTLRMVDNPFDSTARPVHCLFGEPAQFTADKREPLLTRSPLLEPLLCAPAVSGAQGTTMKTFYNPNYVEPDRKDKDKGKKK